jgi:hypothetical protein
MRVIPLRSTVLAIVVGTIAGLFAAQAPVLVVLGFVACFGLLLVRRPLPLFGLFLMVDHTYAGTSYYEDVGRLVTTGHQLYQPVKHVAPALVLLLLALGVQLYSGRGFAVKRIHAHGLDAFGSVLVSLIMWTTMLSLAQEKVDFSSQSMAQIAINTVAAGQPWLLALAAYAVAVPMLREPGGRAALARLVAGVLIVKGVLGLLVLATSQGAVIDGQRYVVYYDAALPMVAGMAIVGYLLAAERALPWRKMILLLAGTIVVFSFRRSVWSAMAAAVVVLPVIRMHGVVLRRIFTVALLGLAVLLATPSTVKDAAFGRVGSAVSVAQGTGNEDSARNHKLDLEQGFRFARQHPWIGLGVRAPQRREFAYQGINRLYVHNDPLQVWLRFGLPGVALFLLLFVILAWRGVATLRRRSPLSVLDAGCAAFAIVCILSVLPAPFVSDTIRWPILVGIVAAVLRTGATDERDAAVSSADVVECEPPVRQAALAEAVR